MILRTALIALVLTGSAILTSGLPVLAANLGPSVESRTDSTAALPAGEGQEPIAIR